MIVVWVMFWASVFHLVLLGGSIIMHPPAEPVTVVTIAAVSFVAGLALGVLLYGPHR